MLSRIGEKIESEPTEEDSVVEAKVQENIEKCEKCEKCKDKIYKYICPKCKIKYCSVDCYKAHSVECTESFYKTQVEQELKSLKVSEDEGKAFRKTLKDYYEKLQDDTIIDAKVISKDRKKHLESLLKKIESDTINIEKDLLPEDWNEFNKFLSGYAGDGLTLWKPFWFSTLSNDLSPSLVYDTAILKQYDEATLQKLKEYNINDYIEYEGKANQGDDLIENYLADLNIEDISIQLNGKIVPMTRDIIYHSLLLKYNDVKPLEMLTKVKPNENLPYTLVNIISNVVYIFKLYNGDLTELNDMLNILLDNCKILYDKSIIYTSTQMALDDFFTSVFRRELKYQKETRQMIKQDTAKVLSNKFLLFESFVRLYELLHEGGKRKEITLAKNKLIYLMSYIRDHQLNEQIITEINNY
jgi:hypothetical protein